MLAISVEVVFKQLEAALVQISNEQYSRSLSIFSGSSVGAHSRHIAEVVNELLAGYDSGVVNYSNRKRDKLFESDRLALINCLNLALSRLNYPDKPLELHTDFSYDDTTTDICKSTYYRELAYVLEHTVHHMALIKIGLLYLNPLINLPVEFGVAAATIKSTKACAQ